ncbi:CHAT domain-containing protein [Streptomyces sp. NBC_01285]|uniref:CHAT domain-containing protein n=1 Tax=Streptomyces sp. NBC_01285 TaxID=2903813 RepID=UPI002252D6EB|nr:CHAT domain-containing protein [Streptomyces sp. NBC_01285]MCX4769808.1 CHAT domain-containing protein [Streptomyces sp. NBC_01285]
MAAEQDLGVVLEPEALVEARRLAAMLKKDESGLEAHYVLGWLHALRYKALPGDAGATDKAEAIAMLAPCFLDGADDEDVPEELFPDVARYAIGFAMSMQKQAETSTGPALLSQAINLLRRIVAAIPPTDADHANALCNMALALHSRFNKSGEPADLDMAVEVLRSALASAGAGHRRWPVMLSNLAAVLQSRHEQMGAGEDLDEAIETSWAALRATEGAPGSSAGRVGGFISLGNALLTRFAKKGDLSDLDATVEAFEDAASLAAEGRERAGILHSLGTAWHTRYERTGAPADLEEAFAYCRAAVEAAPPASQVRAMCLSGLGTTSLTRFNVTGDATDLSRSINAYRAALEGLPDGHQDRALRLSGLGSAFLARFRAGGDREDLERAIESGQAAVRESGPQRTDFSSFLNNLSNSLWQRFEHAGDEADLNEAINTCRASAQATAPGHVLRPARLTNVGLMLWTRYKHSGALSDLDAAVELSYEAVQATSPGQPDRAGMLSNLGLVLAERYERKRTPQDLDEAILRSREAVGATHADRPDRSRYLANLCCALNARFQSAGSTADLDEAIESARAACDTIPPDHPELARYFSALGAALVARFEKTGSASDLNDAVEAGRMALGSTPAAHPERAVHLSNLGTILQRRYDRAHSQDDADGALAAHLEASRADGAKPSIRIRSARAAAALVEQRDPGLAADLLSMAVRLLHEVADHRLNPGDKQHAMSEWSGLAGDAAALTLAVPTGAPADLAVRALQLLETGRGVLLSKTLDSRSDLADLRREHPGLAKRFENLRDRLDQPADTMAAPADLKGEVTYVLRAVDAEEHRRSLVGDQAATLECIRAQEGFESFACPPGLDELLSAAAFGPVVSFTISRRRSDALLLTVGGIQALNLPDLTYDALLDRIQVFHRALESIRDPGTSILGRKAAQAELRSVLGWLWNSAAEPVLRSLGFTTEPLAGETLPRIWWAPGGLLGLLPLHAAGYHSELSGTAPGGERGRTVMDRVVSSYTPTIRALQHARRHRAPVPRVHRSLIVAMPTTPGIEGRLEHVQVEAELLSYLLPRPTLLMEHDKAAGNAPHSDSVARPTKDRVREHLPYCGIVHFACHGAHDPADPSQSFLLLHDYKRDPLTVESVTGMKVEVAQLAYLSACRTAFMGSMELIDESLHLTSAFQLAGFPHVIGTLWEINDEVASYVAADFYAELGAAAESTGNVDTDGAAVALHHAVRRVRDQFPATPYLWAAHLHAGI